MERLSHLYTTCGALGNSRKTIIAALRSSQASPSPYSWPTPDGSTNEPITKWVAPRPRVVSCRETKRGNPMVFQALRVKSVLAHDAVDVTSPWFWYEIGDLGIRPVLISQQASARFKLWYRCLPNPVRDRYLAELQKNMQCAVSRCAECPVKTMF